MIKEWEKWLEQEKDNALEEKWDFRQFKIECSKCNSKNVEINGTGNTEVGWYQGEGSHTGSILVKCHNCGNAMRIDLGSWWELKAGEKKNED